MRSFYDENIGKKNYCMNQALPRNVPRNQYRKRKRKKKTKMQNLHNYFTNQMLWLMTQMAR